jgi:hypothetical protein
LLNNIFVCQTLRHIYTVLILLDAGVIRSDNGSRVTVIFCVDHQGITEQEIDFSLFSDFGIELIIINDFVSKNISISWSGVSFASSWLYEFFSGFFDMNRELDRVFLFHDRTFIGKCFVKFRNVTLIEDGFANYNKNLYNATFLKKFIRLLTLRDPRYYVLGESKNIKNVILFSTDSAPVEIRKKISVVNLKDLSSKVSDTFISRMNALFRFNVLNYFNNDSVFFLTQGLDVASLCSIEEKLAIYEPIIEFISRYKKVILKLHPSESVEQYSALVNKFKNVDIASPKIPFELYSLNLKGKSTKIYSLYTSASIGSLISIVNLVPTESDWINFNSKSMLNKAMEALRNDFNVAP